MDKIKYLNDDRDIRLFHIIILPNLSLGLGGSSMTICVYFLYFCILGTAGKIEKSCQTKKLFLKLPKIKLIKKKTF